MRGTRRLVWVIAAMMAAVFLASGVALAATLTGTNNGDTINGTENADTIDGKGGGDTIDGRAGEDTIEGGDGRDTIRGGTSDDEIYGGNKQGSIADGGNVIYGETGNDTIEGGPGTDELYGGENTDTISGKGGNDTIKGGTGNDYLFGTDKYQTGIEDGNRTSIDGNDVIEGEDDDDTIVGASGADELYGNGGNDTLTEGPVNDAAVDYVYGGAGNDKITVLSEPASRDIVDCGEGTDEVEADPLDDVNGNCENVDIVSDPASSETTVSAQSTQGPVVRSTENKPRSSSSPAPDATTSPRTPPSGEVTAQSYQNIYCRAYPYWRGQKRCGNWRSPYYYYDVGLYNTSITQWIYWSAWSGGAYTTDYFWDDGYLHETYDVWDDIYPNYDDQISLWFARDCSACYKTNYIQGWFEYYS